MEAKEKDIIKLKIALIFKRLIEKNKVLAIEQKAKGSSNTDLISSYRKLETASGIRNATILEIIAGEKNAAITTLITLIAALNISVAEFGALYDKITDAEAEDYKKQLQKTRQERSQASTKKKQVQRKIKRPGKSR